MTVEIGFLFVWVIMILMDSLVFFSNIQCFYKYQGSLQLQNIGLNIIVNCYLFCFTLVRYKCEALVLTGADGLDKDEFHQNHFKIYII